MGDRAVIQFKADEKSAPINLYMHWGGHDRYIKLAKAIEAARPRWTDPEYATRICISQIVGDDWNSEFGFGISVGDDNARHGDYNDIPCVIWDRKVVRVQHDSGIEEEVIGFNDFETSCLILGMI